MKRILCTGNGDELLEQVGGRVYRHVYDQRSKRYITIGEDVSSSYGVQVRAHGFRVNDVQPFDEAWAAAQAEADDMAATMDAASGRWGY